METWEKAVAVGDSLLLEAYLQTQAHDARLPSDTNITSATVLVFEEGHNTFGTCDAGGSANTVVDAERTEATTDWWKGIDLEFLSGSNKGQRRTVSAFSTVTKTLTLQTTGCEALSTPAAGDTYVLWGYPIVNQQDLDTHASGVVTSNKAQWHMTAANGCTAAKRTVIVRLALTYANGSFSDVKTVQYRVRVG